MTKQYLAAGIGRPEQFTCIRSGFALPNFLSAKSDPGFRASLGLAPTDFVVGMIARLCELKGHDDLIAAAPMLVKRCPQMKFLLVGDGPSRDRLRARAQALSLQGHFVFAGLVPPTEIPRYLGAMDVLAHLSRREGLARALPQALAVARPVVAYDCDGAREICLPDETGYLIRPGDLQQLTERLLQLAGEPALRERFGQQGQRLVKERFSVERMVDNLYQLYRRLQTQMRNDP
jgi:glycosyltransferase involved in cell wall biosynthesis